MNNKVRASKEVLPKIKGSWFVIVPFSTEGQLSKNIEGNELGYSSKYLASMYRR